MDANSVKDSFEKPLCNPFSS